MNAPILQIALAETPPLDFLIDTVAFAAIPAAIFGLVGRRRKEGEPDRGNALWTGLGVMAGFFVALWRHDGRPVLSPATAQQWLPILAVGGFALGALIDAARAQSTDRARPRSAFAFALPALVALTALSFSSVYSYTGRMALITGSLATTVGVLLTIHLVRRNQRFAWAARFTYLTPAAWIVYVLWRYNEMVPSAAPALLVSLVVAVSPGLPFENRGPAWRAVGLRTLLALVAGGLAVGLTRASYEPFVY